MQKYKLLKDLPLADVGTIVSLRVKGVEGTIESESGDEMYAYIDLFDLSKWLEKVETDKYSPEKTWKEFITNEHPNKILLNKTEEAAPKTTAGEIVKILDYCLDNDINIYPSHQALDKFYINVENKKLVTKKILSTDELKGKELPLRVFFEYFLDTKKVIDDCEESLKVIFNI